MNGILRVRSAYQKKASKKSDTKEDKEGLYIWQGKSSRKFKVNIHRSIERWKAFNNLISANL